MIDNSDDYNLPMGEGGREGVMKRGREEKEPNETNDDYRIVNDGSGARRQRRGFNFLMVRDV